MNLTSLPGGHARPDAVARRAEFERGHPDAEIWQDHAQTGPHDTGGWHGSLPVGEAVQETGPWGDLNDVLDVLDALACRAALIRARRAEAGQ